MSPPLAVSPEPAFIAGSAASQIVTNDHDSHAESWYDQHGIEPSGEPATVSPAALQLVNSFLDQLLFNFLCVSRSTALSTLRPAVSEVLKPKLAKDAINQADEELREYLGGDDEDPSEAQDNGPISPADWDVELVWKRTRLRCMVYSSLGDMEEEDEDFYREQGHLETGLEERLSEAVSPAVAIFLTSILEFMGEQALIVAGQAAYHRMRVKYDKELKEGLRSPTGLADKIVVEELDMERVALDRTLGRLWRSWKKKIRSPGAGTMERLTRSFSGDSMRGAGHLRSSSSTAELMVPATVPEPEADVEAEQGEAQTLEGKARQFAEDYEAAVAIPLPLGPNDVEEIEVPGLARNEDDEDELEDGWEILPARPKSMVVLPLSGAPLEQLTPTQSRPHTPIAAITTRKRSNSLPTPATTPYMSPVELTPVESVEDLPKEDQRAAKKASETAEKAVPAQEDAKIAVGTDAQSPAKETEVDDDKIEDEDDEVSIEEPRIVRSSRVSILGGRNPSPTTSDNGGRPSLINTNLPMMSPGIHSARLIEVTSPRSPVVNSQRSSLTASDSSRQTSPSRLSGAGTPPADERPHRSPDSVSRSRLSVHHAHRSGPNANKSIPGGDEGDNDYTVSPITPLTPSQTGTSLPAIPEAMPKDYQQIIEASKQASRSNTPTATERSRSATPSSTPAPTAKVTILPSTSSSPSRPSTATSGTFFIESMPVLADGRSTQAKSQAYRPSQVTAPAVPERNAGRQAIANTSAQRQPATIGQVSVERSRGGSSSPSDSQSGRIQEAAAASTRPQRGSGSPSSTKIKPVRTSEEGMQARIDVVRNFEELIQSDQTIQYTLTPENIQSINTQLPSSRPSKGSGSPVISVKTRKSEDTRHNQNAPRSRSSSAARSTEMTASGPNQRSVGHVSQLSDTHHSLRSYPTSTSKHGGLVPRSTPPVASKPRGSAPQARDARLPRESLAEFAEFIRSTGPSGGGTAPVNAFSGPGGPRNPGMMSMTSVVSSRGSMTSNPNRPRLQARDAAVDYKDDNSDLIDFIRRGPPNAGPPRIPKAVAPFRTTMDSDQMSGAVGGKAIDAHLNESEIRGSQASTSSVPPSVQSSVNSRSALLAGNNNNSSSNNAGMSKPLPDGMDFDTDMPMPKRKTRRVRDPYAIDLSDEEDMMVEEELTPKPKRPPPPREESLIDFLNSYPPPPETNPVPFAIAQTTKPNKPKKKSSSTSLMARLTRRDSGQAGVPGSGGFMGSKVPQMPSTEARSLSSRASASVNTGRSFTPIQAVPNAGSKAAAMMGGGPGPTMMSRPSASSGGRVTMKKFEPREAVLVPSRGTSDLADFLKHSAPPPGTNLAAPFPEPMSPERDRRESNNISKMFGRRKKASVS